MSTSEFKVVRVTTKAFSEFSENCSQVSSFFNMTQTEWMNPLAFINQEKLEKKNVPEKEKQYIYSLATMTRLGKSVAARMLIVYLGTMIETYIRDAIIELLQKKQTNVNLILMGRPRPTNEDEDISIYVDLQMALEDEKNPVYTLGKLAVEYINTKLRHDSVNSGIKILKDEYHVRIRNEADHKNYWGEFQKLRNKATHHIDDSNSWNCYSEGVPTINNIKLNDDYLTSAIEHISEYVKDIEEGITDSMQERKI